MTTTVIKKLQTTLVSSTSILPLAIFRIVFGGLMCFSQLRFLSKGWIEDCYTNPDFHFTYQFFDWIKPFDTTTMYMIVVASALFALCIALGSFYRLATILFFLSFTYLELIEKSWYLNHYYFASLVAFLLIWLPAHRNYSIDAKLFKNIRLANVPVWTILILKLQIAVVYLFGGIAKLKSDWLFEAQPLKIWLQARTDTPLLGSLFQFESTAYLFSWTGTIYDLTIPFLLFYKRSRPWAYILVVIFHVLTYALFNIGMFPWMMVGASLIFISTSEWQNVLKKLRLTLPHTTSVAKRFATPKLALPLIIIYLGFQFVFPLRHFVLTDNVLWTENGFRFAWHVMLMEKNGFTEFRVVDNTTCKEFRVYPLQYLSVIQEKQMSFQPDMIWQFTQFLGKEFDTSNTKDLSIYVNSKVSLNGRKSQTYIDPKTDLLQINTVDKIYAHVLPLKRK